MRKILLRVEHMSRGNLIFPLEHEWSSLVTEHNVVMSFLGKVPDFMLHNSHRQWKGKNVTLLPLLLFALMSVGTVHAMRNVTVTYSGNTSLTSHK